MAEDGEEKLLATVQHIAKTLGRTGTMTEDILKVFSNYDGRLSLEKLYAAAAAAGGGGGAGEHSMPASSPPPSLPSAAAAMALAVAAASRAPERLFRVIDMYEAVRDLLPDLDPVFADPYSAAFRAEVSAVCNTLGSSIKGIFMELENLIRRDPARVAIPGGGIHPITRYVMNYLRAACGSRQTLEEVMEGDLGALGVTAIAVDPDRPTSSLAVHIAWIMDVLHKNLETKSKIYRDPPLASIFLMNNGKYIIQKVNDSELGVLLGDEWMKQMLSRVRRWSMEYQRGAWAKVMSVLHTGGSGFSSLPAKAMLQKLQMFNGYLDEICSAQSEWVITDEQLRADVRAAITDSVVPAYKGLIGKLKSSPEAPQDLFIKHTPEDIEACIQHLFQGVAK